MFNYFGYGSNLSVVSLRAKGVEPIRSKRAVLPDFRLLFNVENFFSIEGGAGNIEPSVGDQVHGVIHTCADGDLKSLDQLEALGVAYKRVTVTLETDDGPTEAYAYVGLHDRTADGLRPSERYRHILVDGARAAELPANYVAKLQAVPALAQPNNPPFDRIDPKQQPYTLSQLTQNPTWVGLYGAVFDMAHARPHHDYLRALFSGKDATLLLLKRMHTSDGTESFSDLRNGVLTPLQRQYLNNYLYEFSREYELLGALSYARSRPTQPRRDSYDTSELVLDPGADSTGLPARRVLNRAAHINTALAHENLGFLSESHGFLPKITPLRSLPETHAAWDQIAADLPRHYRDLTLRRALEALPNLPTDAGALPDRFLLRAVAILSAFAHAYWYCEVAAPTELPDNLDRAWADVRKRLGRPDAVLSYIDLIVYNYKFLHSDSDPINLETTRLLVPTVNNKEEQIFYGVQRHILAVATPLVGAIVRAQEAAEADRKDLLMRELQNIVQTLHDMTRNALPFIHPNPYHPSYMDPAVWARTVAPFAVPIIEGVQGPSGTSSPIFNVMDVFFGRVDYASFLGREIKGLRATYPQHWRSFIAALAERSIGAYVHRSKDSQLLTMWLTALEAYTGQNGLLGRHRLKVYGFLEIAFKVGRSVTIGGFSGAFRDRTWDQIDDELEIARRERSTRFPERCHQGTIVAVEPTCDDASDDVALVSIGVEGNGIRYEPGDRLGILPRNAPRIVQRTIDALRAPDNARVELTAEWCRAIQLRVTEPVTNLTLREFLTYGSIRPVTPRVAESLLAMTQDAILAHELSAMRATRWELWDLLQFLTTRGLDPRRLWDPEHPEFESISRIVPPETFRMYSIASITEPGVAADVIQLTVRVLSYTTPQSTLTEGGKRFGTASTFLTNAGYGDPTVSFVIQHPAQFVSPPPDRPAIFIAGGTGISPFIGFIAERVRQGCKQPCHLFFATRSRQQFHHRKQLAAWVQQGYLHAHVAFSRDDVRLGDITAHEGGFDFELEVADRSHIDDLLLAPETAKELWNLIKPTADGGGGAPIFICGRTGFATTASEAIETAIARSMAGSAEQRAHAARQVMRQLSADSRFVQEIYTDAGDADDAPNRIPFSKVACRNSDETGYWMVIDKIVYDMTEFMHHHPGGAKLLKQYAGRDASEGFQRSHQGRPEIESHRDAYAIGVIDTPDFMGVAKRLNALLGTPVVSLAALHRRWVLVLDLAAEMQNGLRTDHSLYDAITTSADNDTGWTHYKLDRAIETHERFLVAYVSEFALGPMRSIWTLTTSMCSEQPATTFVDDVIRAYEADQNAAREVALLRQMRALLTGPDLTDEGFTSVCAGVRVLHDNETQFLIELKDLLIRGVTLLETHGPDTLEEAGSDLESIARDICLSLSDRAKDAVDAMQHIGWTAETDAKERLIDLSLPTPRILAATDYWHMEEYPESHTVVLRRTATPLSSLQSLISQNNQVIAAIRSDHDQYGLVVDVRHIPVRNDRGFEDAMAALRVNLVGGFRRMAMLVESNAGVLQVNRIGRNEGDGYLVTQSETTARRFVMPDAVGSA